MTDYVFSLIILFFSVAFHEAAHGFIAWKMGDPTARYEGRITLNPVKHFDLMGSFIFPLTTLLLTAGRGPIFGWAKPVPINPYNFRNRKIGEAAVSLAGPGVNFLIAVVTGILIRLAIDVIPGRIVLLLIDACLINLSLGFFNLLPVPPLDGSRLFLNFLPERMEEVKSFLERYGFFIIFLMFYLGVDFVSPIVSKVFGILSGIYF